MQIKQGLPAGSPCFLITGFAIADEPGRVA